MFWAVILIAMLLVVGASVAVGAAMNRRSDRRRPRSARQKKIDMAKASGAFTERKSNR